MKSFVTFLAIISFTIAGFGQGQVDFLNTAATLISVNGTAMPGANTQQFIFALFLAPSTTVSSPGQTIAFNDSRFQWVVAYNTNHATASGRLVTLRNVVVSGATAGETVDFVVRGWSANAGATWQEALANYNNGSPRVVDMFIGSSTVGNDLVLGGGAIPIPPLFGISAPQVGGFNMGNVNPCLGPCLGPVQSYPVSQIVVPGAAVEFYFGVYACPQTQRYQWFLNGLPIPGATYSRYQIANANPSDAGSYWVEVENVCSGVRYSLSAGATLQVTNSVDAQFKYTTNNGAITITKYTGAGGTVTIPGEINGLPVIGIGTNAFSGKSSLTNVVIPDSVTNIGDQAFYTCTNLTTVTISSNLNNIGSSLFYGCSKLASITIPNSVTKIGNSAFRNCTSLTNITIPNSVTSIGTDAFYFCTSLTSVMISNGISSIGTDAFFYCTNLTSVSIPNSVTIIGDDAFNSCSSMTSVSIGSGVTSIGSGAFGRGRLTAITVDVLNPAYSSVDGVLFNKNQTKLIQYPQGKSGNYTIPSTVTNIWDRAFEVCGGLANVTIPDSVTSIGVLGFASCTGLTNVSIGNSVSGIGHDAFAYCTNLISVNIPDGVTTISAEAFYRCTSLTGVTMGDHVTSIGANAFYFCTSLTNITIPNSVRSIGSDAFLWCTSLTSLTIPNSVTNIDDAAFAYCWGLARLSIGNGLASIGNSVFHVCYGLTNVVLPSSITTIGQDAFQGCSGLTSITIPSSVTSIGMYAFQGCTSLRGAYFLGNAPSAGAGAFDRDDSATLYYLSGTTGWGATFGGRPTSPGSWPEILNQPASQTAEAGSTVRLRVTATGSPPPVYHWRFNDNVASGNTNSLLLTNVQFAQSGGYTVVVGNGFGSVTSAPATLNVISPVQRRVVPGIVLTAQSNSLLNVEYRSSLLVTQDWESFPPLYFTNSPQFFFDLSTQLPPQRFYRATQIGPVSVEPSLNIHMIPALTLTGTPGDRIRIDAINQFGPTNAWFTLATVTLTNTSQLFFDVTALQQPQRLYWLVPEP